MTELELWYDKPAVVWTEALPIGNGRLGGMVFGDTSRDRLQLNESTFFSGGPYTPLNRKARGSLDDVRRLIFSGQYRAAEELAHRNMMADPYLQMSYQPIGDVWVTFHHPMIYTDYRRGLDLDSAIATTKYRAGKATYKREVFASPVSDVIVYRITADQPQAIYVDLALSSPQNGHAEPAKAGGLLFVGKNRREQGVEGALDFAFGMRIINQGGLLTTTPDTVRVRGADSVTLLIDAATSFKRFDDVSGDAEGDVQRRLNAAVATNIEVLREQHLAEHRRLFRGFEIELGTTTASTLPTDRRIALNTGKHDPALAALFMQYGRYLKIASSRPGTQPSNLQGIWNEEVRPSWGSKYTTNINLEMNYWLPDPSNLAECFEPLIELVEDVAVRGAETARVHYGARGWVLHHNTDLWRATGPVDGPQWGLWPMGGVWLCAQLWDHYEFSGSEALLRRIYPLMKGAAEFLLDYLVALPGTDHLVTCPSVSPENQHPFGTSLCAGPAMDNQIIRDLFAGVIEASTQLDDDPLFRAQVQAARARLPVDRVGKAGQLQEWIEDWDMEVPEVHHRHVSHLYGIYPSWQINLDDTPALAKAAQRSLELRGDDATGWGIGWRLNLWARLRNGQRAFDVLQRLLSPERTYPNLFDSHPPFQIDGNFGGAAGIVEMLVQSRRGRIDLLPALPAEWPEGHIAGVRGRGGVTVDVTWKDGIVSSAVLVSMQNQPLAVHWAGGSRTLDLMADQPTELNLAPAELV